MTPTTEVAPNATGAKPKIAYALATAFGVGHWPKAPGTYGSLVGVITIVLSAIFFLRPTSLAGLSPLNVLSEARFMDKHFLVPGSDIHDTVLWLPIFSAIVLMVILGGIGVWSAGRTAQYAGIKDPQFVVIDEVAGQHLTLLLPLIPIALPNLRSHMDLSMFAIFSALSLVNWKYLLLGFVFFRIFDVWKPWPIAWFDRRVKGGFGVMLDDVIAGLFAGIVLYLVLLLVR